MPRFYLIVGFLLAVWIYLIIVVRKKKADIFHDQMEPVSAERRYKMLKTFLLVAGISLAVGIVTVLLGIAIFGPTEDEGPVAFFIAFFFCCAVCCRNYWRPGYISQRTTKSNIKEYRNKYNLTVCFTTN